MPATHTVLLFGTPSILGYADAGESDSCPCGVYVPNTEVVVYSLVMNGLK